MIYNPILLSCDGKVIDSSIRLSNKWVYCNHYKAPIFIINTIGGKVNMLFRFKNASNLTCEFLYDNFNKVILEKFHSVKLNFLYHNYNRFCSDYLNLYNLCQLKQESLINILHTITL